VVKDRSGGPGARRPQRQKVTPPWGITLMSLLDTAAALRQCGRLSASDYYGGSAPPGPFNGRRVYPAPLTWMPAWGGSRDRAVPVFTAVRSLD